MQTIVLFLVISVSVLAPGCVAQEDEHPRLTFWDQQRKGANGDGGADSEVWFDAAARQGIEFIRVSPATWEAHGDDFLIGDADGYTGLPAEDVARLNAVLDAAHRHGVKVVLTMFSLPGARWRQHNDGAFDDRLWRDVAYRQQAAAFWRELAALLKNHPALAGYNPINEPYPARTAGYESGRTDGFDDWLAQHNGSAADLNRFNQVMVEAIRSVDPDTPIILDGWFHAAPEGFRYLTPVEDEAVLYAFHFYEPWTYTTFRVNRGAYSYPDRMPIDGSDGTEAWTAAHLRQRIEPVVAWMERFDVPPTQIIAEEFGCDHRVPDAAAYLTDLIDVLNAEGWHWAFYAFRSPDWDGMDYELGTERLGAAYWEQREAGIDHEALVERRDNPLWDVFKKEFSGAYR